MQALINEIGTSIQVNKNVSGAKELITELKNYTNKLKALQEMEHSFELFLYYYEDAMDNEVDLLAKIQGF